MFELSNWHSKMLSDRSNARLVWYAWRGVARDTPSIATRMPSRTSDVQNDSLARHQRDGARTGGEIFVEDTTADDITLSFESVEACTSAQRRRVHPVANEFGGYLANSRGVKFPPAPNRTSRHPSFPPQRCSAYV